MATSTYNRISTTLTDTTSGGYVETAGVLLFVWSLLPKGTDYTQPYVTPLNAPIHAGLPPAILVTCGFDMLRDVGHAYARKLAQDGNGLTTCTIPSCRTASSR